jgi:hypothetical protein
MFPLSFRSYLKSHLLISYKGWSPKCRKFGGGRSLQVGRVTGLDVTTGEPRTAGSRRRDCDGCADLRVTACLVSTVPGDLDILKGEGRPVICCQSSSAHAGKSRYDQTRAELALVMAPPSYCNRGPSRAIWKILEWRYSRARFLGINRVDGRYSRVNCLPSTSKSSLFRRSEVSTSRLP